ncbi:MAG TPA: hypothetical protein VLJ37_05795 [bacterium]|nr:hypothetical protein [bacterium]
MRRIVGGLLIGAALWASGCGGAQGNKGSWKAVFLTSGQVYYGKLTQNQGQFYKLQDVYYIRVNQQQEDKTKPPDLTLVKLGNEVHGPEDAIYLNRDHILYIEDLKEDGQVVKAIADAKAAGTTPAVAGTPPAPDATPGTPAVAATGTPASVSPQGASALPPDKEEEFRQFQEFLKSKKAQEEKKK